MTHTKNSAGFGVIGIILVIAVVSVLGFVGWSAWHKSNEKKPTVSTVTPDAVTNAWTSITFRDNSFTMKVPDGWTLLRSTQDVPQESFTTLDSKYEPGVKAVITGTITATSFGKGPVVSIKEDPDKNLESAYASSQEDATPFRTVSLTGVHTEMTTEYLEGQPANAPISVLHEYYFTNKGKGLLVSVTVEKGDAEGEQVVAQLEKALVTLR